MSVDKVDLVGDYLKVKQKEQEFSKIEDKILNYSATPKEIRDWCYSRDPLFEDYSLSILSEKNIDYKGLNTDSVKIANRMHLLYKSAAFGLLLHVFNPEFSDMGLEDRIKYSNLTLDVNALSPISKEKRRKLTNELIQKKILDISTSSISDEDSDSLVSIDRWNEFFIENIKTLDPMDIDIHDLENLETYRFAADILYKASIFGDNNPWVNNSTFESRRTSGDQSDRLYDLISDIGLESDNLEAQIIGAKAKWALFSKKIPNETHITIDEVGKTKHVNKNKMLEMVQVLRKVFLENSSIKLTKGTIQGTLYELMWLLDFQVSLLHNDHRNGDIAVNSATNFDDAPEVGYPENNRGYDYTIRDLKTGKLMVVQLKSSSKPKFDKKYHPVIVHIKEDFPYVQRTRLKSKLDSFEKYIKDESGESWYTAKKFVFKSVIDVQDLLAKEDMSYVQKIQAVRENN